MEGPNSYRRICFGPFEVDRATGELRKQGRRIKLQEQPFQVLAALLEKPGELVTREELRQRIWSDDTFVDFDHSLNKAINKVREVLGDSSSNPRYVETLPRRGYRFIGTVTGSGEVTVEAQETQRSSSSSTRWRLAGAAGLITILLVGVGAWWWVRSSRGTWAREEVLPEIARLADNGSYVAAFRLVQEAEQHIPEDPTLVELRDKISRELSIHTTPSGAEVEFKVYNAPDDQWVQLGKTPLEEIRIPLGYFRWRISKPGFATQYSAGGRIRSSEATLAPEAAVPEAMVRVPSRESRIDIPLLGLMGPFLLEQYFIDRHEVTNRQFQQFVELGGYRREEFWKDRFVKNGRVLSWEEAMNEFRDATGRPGPSTWEGGQYPEGHGDFPVAGVSWYEAAAYAEFTGKSLPTIFHWYRAAGMFAAQYIVPLSNFGTAGPVPAEQQAGIGPFGTNAMAGNVKEWCWSQTDSKRFILGGAWNEPTYSFSYPDARSPFDRASTNGFRCVRYTSPIPDSVKAPQELPSRDYEKEEPVNDDLFQVYKRMYAYDPRGLNARVESVDESSRYWTREKITFDAAYGNERVIAHLLLPKSTPPPYQTVAFFPGTPPFHRLSSSENLSFLRGVDFIIKSGRALLYPVYQASYERRSGLYQGGLPPPGTIREKDLFVMWSKDLGRSLDYLETRSDIDRNKFAYLGLSWGAQVAPVLAAVEDRLKTCILLMGGLGAHDRPPECDPFQFAPRLTSPTLMLNGRLDFIFPVKTSQRPLFRLLGTPENDKRHLLFDTSHSLFQVRHRHQWNPEVLTWLDRYLGPVE